MEKISKEIVKGSFWLYLGASATLFFTWLSTIVLARLLDKELWGIFASTIMITSFLSAFYDLGIGYSITHQLSKSNVNKKKRMGIVEILIKYKIILTLIFTALIFLFSDFIAYSFHSPSSGIYFKVSAVYFFLFNFSGTFDNVFNGLKWFKQSTLISGGHYLLRFVFPAVLVYFGFGVSGALIGYIIALVLVTAAQYYLLRKFIFIKSNCQERISPLIVYGFFMGISAMIGSIVGWTDSIILGVLIGTTAVGIYKIAFGTTAALATLIATFNRVIFPIFTTAESGENRGRHIISALNNVLKYGSFFIMPAMFGIILSSGGIIQVFFGTQYAESALPLAIMSYFLFDGFFTGAILTFFAAKGETAFIGTVSIITAIVNVLFNLILIPIFGIPGAASASVITRLLSLVVILNECSKRGIAFDLSSMVKPFLGAVFMSILLTLLIFPIFSEKPLLLLDNVLALAVFVLIGIGIYFVAETLMGFDVFFVYKIIKTIFSR